MTVKEFIKKNQSLFNNAEYISVTYYEDGVDFEDIERTDNFYNTSDFINNSDAADEIFSPFIRIVIGDCINGEYSINIDISYNCPF